MHAKIHSATGRNESMECFKLIASFFVVLIHCPFPDPVGSMVICLSRFAVPVFFAISGYFSYGVNSRKLYQRLLNIAKLYIFAVVFCAVLGTVTALCTHQNIAGYLWGFVPGTENLATMILLHMSFFPGTEYTWYLIGIGFCYLILILYTGFFADEPVCYRPLYYIGIVLLIMNLLMGEMTRAVFLEVPYKLYRNGLFMGLPMFTLGLFIHEYYHRIMKNYRLNNKKLLSLLFLGILLTVIQWKGVGTGELPVGVIPQVVAWMLLLVSHPSIGMHPRIIKLFGTISTYVYLVHFPLIGIYGAIVLPLIPAGLTAAESWLRPFVVFLLSALTGILLNFPSELAAKRKQKA